MSSDLCWQPPASIQSLEASNLVNNANSSIIDENDQDPQPTSPQPQPLISGDLEVTSSDQDPLTLHTNEENTVKGTSHVDSQCFDTKKKEQFRPFLKKQNLLKIS